MRQYRKPTKLYRSWQRFRNWVGWNDHARLALALLLAAFLVYCDLYFRGMP